MWATKDDALKSTGDVAKVVGAQFNGEEVVPDLYYNQTATPGDPLEDLFEVFQQRLSEQQRDDLAHVLQERNEIFWELLAGDLAGPTSISSRLVEAIPALGPILSEISGAMLTTGIATVGRAISAPPTFADYEEHKARLDRHVRERTKIVFVGHSQGSLFLNAAHDYATQVTGLETVQAVNVAPASIIVHGGYTLSENDRVIGQLLALFGAVPEPNVTIPFQLHDPLLGHDLYWTYLAPDFEGISSISAQLTNAFRTAHPPDTIAFVSATDGSCNTKTADCNGVMADGCEADLMRDEQNCGACGTNYSNLPPISGFLDPICMFGSCTRTREPWTLTVITRVIGGTRSAADFTAYFAGGFAPPPQSCGYPWWDDEFGRIPGSAAGTTISLGEGFFMIAASTVFDDMGGYNDWRQEGDCFGSASAGESRTCTITYCFGDACPATLP